MAGHLARAGERDAEWAGAHSDRLFANAGPETVGDVDLKSVLQNWKSRSPRWGGELPGGRRQA